MQFGEKGIMVDIIEKTNTQIKNLEKEIENVRDNALDQIDQKYEHLWIIYADAPDPGCIRGHPIGCFETNELAESVMTKYMSYPYIKMFIDYNNNIKRYCTIKRDLTWYYTIKKELTKNIKDHHKLKLNNVAEYGFPYYD